MSYPYKMGAPCGAGRFLTMDSESKGLVPALKREDPTCQHVIVLEDYFTKEVFTFFDPYEERDTANRVYLDEEGDQDGYFADGLKMLMSAECIISQNCTGYDFLAFEKTHPDIWHLNYREVRGKDKLHADIFPYRVMDTYVLSCLLNPDRKPPFAAYNMGKGNVGPHSIEAFGIKHGRYKPENEDWSTLTDHMLHRCREDVAIGRLMYDDLLEEWNEQVSTPNMYSGHSLRTAYQMEFQVAIAVARQAHRGFRFDMSKALGRCFELDAKIAETISVFRPNMPQRIRMKALTQAQRVELAEAQYGEEIYLDDELMEEAIDEQPTRGSHFTTCKKLTIASGIYGASVKKRYPHSAGSMQDHLAAWQESAGPYSNRVTELQPCGDGGKFTKVTRECVPQPYIGGCFTPIELEDIPLGNRDAVKQVLYAQGWLGINYNDTEQALVDDGREVDLKPWAGKIDEDSIEAWLARVGEDGVPKWCRDIADWYVLCSRRNQILNAKDPDKFSKTGSWPKMPSGRFGCRGILPQCFNKETGETATEFYTEHGCWPSEGDWRAPAQAFPNATNTSRMRHKVVVNIPSRGLYPLRDLFIASAGYLVLGCDGSGLELRMLAHFLADKIYQEVVLNGDIHTHNQLLAGLSDRSVAKTFIYAFLYGSGIANLAKVCGVTPAEMTKMLERFKRELPALAKLVENITKAGEAKGYLLALDGRRGRIRIKDNKLLVHTILNVLLQMTGSLSMKYSLCFAEDNMIRDGVGLDEDGNPAWVANVHDEVQMEVPEDEVLTMEYQVEDWKKEEKRVHYDEQGRMWSAPVNLGERVVSTTDVHVVIECVRKYHPAGQIIAEAMTQSGEFLKMRCPLAGEYKIGLSWDETH